MIRCIVACIVAGATCETYGFYISNDSVFVTFHLIISTRLVLALPRHNTSHIDLVSLIASATRLNNHTQRFYTVAMIECMYLLLAQYVT